MLRGNSECHSTCAADGTCVVRHVFGEPTDYCTMITLSVSVTSNTVQSQHTVYLCYNKILHTRYIIVKVSNYIILHVKIFINFRCADHFQIKYFYTTIIFNYSRKPYQKPTMFHNVFE